MLPSKGAFDGQGISSCISSEPLKKLTAPGPSKTSNHDKNHGEIISVSSACKSTINGPKERLQPLPSMMGFRLQPRKNLSSFTNHTSNPSSSAFSRGRKRGAPTMMSSLGNQTAGDKKIILSESSGHHIASSEPKKLSRRKNESLSVHSPIFVHHAMQSMSIRSPDPSTPSRLQNITGSREMLSPFIVFSPSLKPCPYRQRPRSQSFCSLDSSTKPPSSVATAPRITPLYGSPRRKYNGNNNYCNNNDFLSTPRSQCHTANASQAPATPTSTRTLPSPRTTPLPRSIRLTPRSRRHREDENSIFLSPNEKLERDSTANENTSISSFEGGVESLKETIQRTASKSSTYVPSPLSCSRTSIISDSAFGGDFSRGSIRVETQSLLGTFDSTSTLDYIISANRRAAGSDFDGSLSDSSSEAFVLANPTMLAQERDAMAMPPPRPSRRRRMSPSPVSRRGSNHLNEEKIENESVNDVACGDSPNPKKVIEFQLNGIISSCEDEKQEFSTRSCYIKPSPAKRKSNYNQVGRLPPIESCCSLVGLGLAESSSSMTESNTEPRTPPSKLNASNDGKRTSSPSKSSVRISRSDADNIHLTITRMALFHQQSSPTLSVRSS